MDRVLQMVVSFGNRIFPGLNQRAIVSFYAAAVVLAFTSLFCFYHSWMGDLNRVYLFFSLFVLGLYFFNLQTRTFFVLALPMILHGVLYDSIRYVPFHFLQPINIAPPYEWDKFLFGISTPQGVILFHEYLLRFSNKIFDIFLGFVYLIHDPIIYILLVYFWKKKSLDVAERFSVSFLVMNLMAFATYIFYPAAAPWYVAKYSFVQPLTPLLGDGAGLSNFMGQEMSSKIFNFNPVVFGAIPSMHAGFAMLSWIYSFYAGKRVAVLTGFYAFSMFFATLYLQHHYLIDVIIGVFYALMAWLIVEKLLLKGIRRVYRFLFRFFLGEELTTQNKMLAE